MPCAVVTDTRTVPEPGGATASTSELDKALNIGAGVAPKWTAVTSVKSVPWIVTILPPDETSASGETASRQ